MKITWTKKELIQWLKMFGRNERLFRVTKEKFLSSFASEEPKEGTLIKVNKIKKYYVSGITKKVVLNSISLDIKTRDIIFLLGSNGAGKTTFVSCLAGLTKIDSGKISYQYEYKKTPYEVMSFAFQKNVFLEGFTIWDYLIFTKRLQKINMPIKYVASLLHLLGLGKHIKVKAVRLSGGQQQRLNLLLALISNPKIIFLDELSRDLDHRTKNKIIDFIKQYINIRNIVAIFVSHDGYEINTLAKRIVILKGGKITHSKTYQSTIKQYGNIYKLLERLS